MTPLHLLHVFPTFDSGGAQMRTVELMARLGRGFRHSVMALEGGTGIAALIPPQVDFRIEPAPPRQGSLRRASSLRGILNRLRPDLLLTYNWGSIDAAIAARLCAGIPFLHAEDGFGADEAHGLKARRVWTRRLVLPGAKAVVVPSRTLEKIALESYALGRARVRYIPNGIDLDRFQPGSSPEARDRFGIPHNAFVVGTVGHLRPEKNLSLLIEAAARTGRPELRLLIAGGGACEPQLRAAAQQAGIADRVVFTGPVADPAPVYAAMDVFALSSATEQMPVALLEAMACGLPAVCTNVGDCAMMLARYDAPFIVPPGDAAALAAALILMLDTAELRREAASTNRRLVEARFSTGAMVDRYRQLYMWAAGRGPSPEVFS